MARQVDYKPLTTLPSVILYLGFTIIPILEDVSDHDSSSGRSAQLFCNSRRQNSAGAMANLFIPTVKFF